MAQDPRSGRSSATLGNNDTVVPELPKEEAFDDDSKVPFITARTFFMTVLVSMGGICFG
jgi:SP family sugar:H+ symporter-like MFS transporter